MAELTPKQKMFADEYILSGNATQSYLKVYKCKLSTADTMGPALLGNHRVKEYINSVNKELHNNKIATMQEVKEFWSETLRNDGVERRDRLKASEYLAKTNAAFTENHNVSGSLMVSIVDDLDGEDDDNEEIE